MSSPAPPDPWHILHLPRTASPAEIKRAYRRLLLIVRPAFPPAPSSTERSPLHCPHRQYHPDKQRHAGDERVIQLNEAYRLLTDPEARETYERGTFPFPSLVSSEEAHAHHAW